MSLAYYLYNGFYCFIQVLFLFLNLKPKINKYASFFIVYIPFTAFALSQKILSFISPVILTYISVAIYFIMALSLFKDKMRTKLFVSLSSWVIFYSVTLIVVSIAKYFGMDIFEINHNISISTSLMFVIATIIFTVVRKKKIFDFSIKKRDILCFTVFVFGQLIMFFAVSYLYSINGVSRFNIRGSKYVFILLMIAISLFVLADILLIFFMKRISQSEKLREELRFRDYQNRINLDYYRAMEENALETRKIRHDLGNILQIVYSLAENGSAKDEVISSQILSQLNKSIENISIHSYTENSLVNAIISNKSNLCRKKNIVFMCDINVPSDISIDEIDICKSFVNILDNAIEAVETLNEENRKVEVSSFIDSGYLYIKTVNPFSAENMPKKGDRGYGQKILSDTAEKYSGRFINETKDGKYTALITMKI